MSRDMLEDVVENFVEKGENVSKYQLKLAKFKILVKGNGSGYVLYGKEDKFYLFKNGGKFLRHIKDFKDPGIDLEILNYINNFLKS